MHFTFGTELVLVLLTMPNKCNILGCWVTPLCKLFSRHSKPHLWKATPLGRSSRTPTSPRPCECSYLLYFMHDLVPSSCWKQLNKPCSLWHTEIQMYPEANLACKIYWDIKARVLFSDCLLSVCLCHILTTDFLSPFPNTSLLTWKDLSCWMLVTHCIFSVDVLLRKTHQDQLVDTCLPRPYN